MRSSVVLLVGMGCTHVGPDADWFTEPETEELRRTSYLEGQRCWDTGGVTTGDVALTNNASCLKPSCIHSDYGEEGAFSTARFEVTEDLSIDSLAYGLRHGGYCNAELPHTVLMWASESSVPQTKPNLSHVARVRGEAVNGLNWYEVDFEDSLDVDVGDYVFVGVELAGDPWKDSLCLRICKDDKTPDANWFSQTPEPPFAWRPSGVTGKPNVYDIDFAVRGFSR